LPALTWPEGTVVGYPLVIIAADDRQLAYDAVDLIALPQLKKHTWRRAPPPSGMKVDSGSVRELCSTYRWHA